MRQTAIIAVLVIGLLVILFASSKPANQSTQAPQTPTDSSKSGSQPQAGATTFKVGLVTPGNVNDGGWSQNAYDGLKMMEKQLGASISNQVAGSPAAAFTAFSDYANNNTDLVIGHASEWFAPQTLEISAAHPKTVFVISGSENAQGSVVGARFLLEDGTYVLGQIAAAMSKSGHLGCVGPKEVPVIKSTFEAFSAGAKSVKPDVQVLTVWTDSWDDIARAKERTLALINNDQVDFVFHNANNGGPGVFQAAQEKKDKNVYVFGSNADQNALADDVILASAVLDIPSAFLSIGKKVKEGKLEKTAQFFGMPEGMVWISYNKKLENKIPPEVRKRADETVEKIKKHELQVPRLNLK